MIFSCWDLIRKGGTRDRRGARVLYQTVASHSCWGICMWFTDGKRMAGVLWELGCDSSLRDWGAGKGGHQKDHGA